MLHDISIATRSLLRDRSFALTAILVLGVGIGVNNMMFTLIYAHTLRGMPIENADRVLFVSALDDRASDRPLSYPEYLDLRTASYLQTVGAFASAAVAIGEEGRAPDRFDASYVTADALTIVARPPLLGRTFHADDDRPGAPPVVILGAHAWRQRYNNDPAVVGRSILVNGLTATVIGVLPPRSGFPSTAEVWLPLSHLPGLAVDRRDTRLLRVIAFVKDGVPLVNARSEVEAIFSASAGAHPDTSQNLRARAIPINERFMGRPTDPAWIAFSLAGLLVVLVSCANVANLLLARAAARAREIAVRSSLGATRRRIVGQVLTESMVLAGLGGAVGLGCSLVGVRVFRAMVPETALPYWIDYSMDARIFAALLVVAMGAVVICGMVPAWQASKVDVNQILKAGGRGSSLRGHRRLTTAFITAEFALTVILLANAAFNIRNQTPALPTDAVVNSTALLTASIALPAATYRTSDGRAAYYRQLQERLAAIPEIAAATIATILPGRVASEQRLERDGVTLPPGTERPTVWSLAIAPQYFSTLAVPVQRGREFSDADGEPGQANAIVNQQFAEMFLGGSDPLGQRIALSSPNLPIVAPTWLTIVGLVPNVRQRVSNTPDPIVYTSLGTAAPAAAAVIVRSVHDPAAVIGRVREVARGLDPNLPLFRTMTMKAAMQEAEWNGRVSSRLAYALTVITFIFSIIGLYAVTAHAVSQQTQEIGIRVALGARPWQVRWVVLRRAAIQVAFGLAAGIAGTIAWDSAIFSGRVDLRFASPDNVWPVALLLSAAVLIACFVPVRRATNVDPVVALRAD